MNDTGDRAFWLHPPHDSRIEPIAVGAPGADELRVRSRYSAVSRGTETLVYTGGVPASEYERMRAPFQAGALPGPVRHGYANVGVVEAGPHEWLGCEVFCLYSHQTRYVVPVEAVVALPADVPPKRAVLAANMETAINALWDTAPGIGERITVIGAGVVGALVAGLAASLPGADVELVDIDDRKAPLGDALGVRFRSPAAAAGERDRVIHASGSEAGLAQALTLAGFEATVTEMSWYGTQAPRVPLGGAFHSRRLTLRASQVGGVAPGQRPRWSHHRRLALAVSLLADARFDALIDAEAPFERLPEVMARLADPHDPTLCQRIRYD